MRYQTEYNRAIDDPEGFWTEKAQALKWFKFPQNILSRNENGHHQWFADGEMNTAYMALDYHVEEGDGDRIAIIFDSPVTGTKSRYTYEELRDEVALTAGMLGNAGVKKGDRVIIYMPMIPEGVIAMLASARIGAIHSVVFGGFSAPELAKRIEDTKPKIILTASHGFDKNKIVEYKPLVDKAIQLSLYKVTSCIVLQRPLKTAPLIAGRDHNWNTLKDNSKPVDCVPVNSTDPLYILYTSGSTGKPKGVVRDNGGHAVAMHYSLKAIYNIDKGDVFWAEADLGWAVSHSYIVYAPLLRGCTTVLFEGSSIDTPDAGTFWRICEEYKVKSLFSAPTSFRAIIREDPDAVLMQKYDLSTLASIFSAGERLDTTALNWLMTKTGKLVVDHWWQTETGWGIAANPQGVESRPIKFGSSTVPTPGYNVMILDDKGNKLAPNHRGNIVIKLPLPPGCLTTVWNDRARFENEYLEAFPGFYTTKDNGFIDDDGYLFVLGRVDDVISVAGYTLPTSQIEEIIARHPSVAECAVIAQDDDFYGQIPIGMVVLKSDSDIDKSELYHQLAQTVRKSIGSSVYYKDTFVVERLPKTRTGKILRKSMRQIINGQGYTVPATIDDPAIMTELVELISREQAVG